MNGHLSAILRFLIILIVALPTMVGGLSSCRRYVGDEQVVGLASAMADSLRYDEPEVADSIVRSLNADSLGSRANTALYALLANEINLYDGQPVEADYVADLAVDYYRLRQWFSESNRHITLAP